MRYLCVAMLALFSLTFLDEPAAEATCRTRCVVQHQAVVVATPVVLATPVVALATPVVAYQQINVPVYSAVYSGASYSEQQAIVQTNLAVVQRLEALGQRLEAMALNGAKPTQLPAGAAQPETKAGAHPGVTFMNNTCVKCHDSSVAAAKGGKHVFFDLGQLVANPQQRLTMIEKVRESTMPPPSFGQKASDEEFNAMINVLATATTAKAAPPPPPPPPPPK